MIGVEGMKIVKNISSWIEVVVERGNFSFNVNGIVFVVDRELMNILEFILYCKKG